MLWVILMEIKVSQVGCFQITCCWICYSIFSISRLKFFSQHFCQKVYEETFLLSSNFKNQFQDVVYCRKLGCLTLWYWNGRKQQKTRQYIFLKANTKTSVWWKFQVLWPTCIKWQAFEFFEGKCGFPSISLQGETS